MAHLKKIDLGLDKVDLSGRSIKLHFVVVFSLNLSSNCHFYNCVRFLKYCRMTHFITFLMSDRDFLLYFKFQGHAKEMRSISRFVVTGYWPCQQTSVHIYTWLVCDFVSFVDSGACNTVWSLYKVGVSCHKQSTSVS